MRQFALAAMVFALALPAAAQTPAPQEQQLATAAHELAALWRPVAGRLTEASLRGACEGALEEMTALDAQLPEHMTVAALAAIRSQQGLVMVPTDENPTVLFVFPSDDLRGVASGLASFRLDPAGQGRVVLRDALGHDTGIQLGQAGGHTLMRINPRQSGDIQTYVGCASTLN